jgi:hypothetical protein
MAVALSFSPNEGELTMDMNFETLYPRHDLLVELGQIEMAMERLGERDESERTSLQPRLESRMSALIEALRDLSL